MKGSNFMLNQFRLIIAEKPSVAQNLAYCVGASERVQDGKNSYFQGNGYIVSNAVGHLFGLGMPEDYGWGKWELETLPVFPEKFRLFPLKGYSEQISLLGKLMKRDDITEIINACDAGREGELIFRYIYEYFKCKKPFKRLWISSLTEESIKNGMANLIDGAEKDNLYLAGQTRAQADFILGMSLSRLYSILNNDVHRVGRVKTPVLNIIASRDEGIESFVKRPYFKLLMDNGAECEKQFDTVLEAAAAQSELTDKTAVVTLAETKRKTENRPLIHSLTSLQREANDIYGITAADTLKAAQSLYEKKLVTYPRTDSNYLSDDMKTLIESTVKCLESYDSQRVGKLLSEGLNIDGRVIDNSRISDHHGIIPTVVIGKLSQSDLNANEQKIAQLIINRFLSVLDKPYIYDETKYEFTVDGVIFRMTVKKPVQLGWKAYKCGVRSAMVTT